MFIKTPASEASVPRTWGIGFKSFLSFLIKLLSGLWSPRAKVNLPSTYQYFTSNSSTPATKIAPINVTEIFWHELIKLVIDSLLKIFTSRLAISPSLLSTETIPIDFFNTGIVALSISQQIVSDFGQPTYMSQRAGNFFLPESFRAHWYLFYWFDYSP